ncbi:universal stress protein [Oricola sp.]|uniref:universal stress protein n=1 Tax=Oricola sp. TaxID=1979950 RepID=UPI003BACD67B
MIKSILCPIDISEPQENRPLLRTAGQLARLHGAKLQVMTVIPDYGMSIVGQFFQPDHHDKAVEHAQQLLRETISAVLGDDIDKDAGHLVATGNAYEKILEVAKAAGVDLIIIGAHKPDFKDYLLGPNAARVVRHAKCSVYVVRE